MVIFPGGLPAIPDVAAPTVSFVFRSIAEAVALALPLLAQRASFF